jgi:hypothetical protein
VPVLLVLRSYNSQASLILMSLNFFATLPYEVLPSSEEAWIFIALTRIMMKRLARAAQMLREKTQCARAA